MWFLFIGLVALLLQCATILMPDGAVAIYASGALALAAVALGRGGTLFVLMHASACAVFYFGLRVSGTLITFAGVMLYCDALHEGRARIK